MDQLLVDWFTKSLLRLIALDVAMGGAIIEEHAISRAQYLDLIYSHSRTLYDLTPNALHPSTNHAKPPAKSFFTS